MALCRFLFFVILKSPPTSDSDFSRSDREPIKVPIKRKALNQLTRELGHEDRFSVYVHASREKPVHTSHYFIGRDIHRETVGGTNHFKHFVRFSSAKKEKEKETFKGWAGTAILVEVEKNAFRKGSQDSPIPIFQS
ncbi:uncharacterized protein [Gossypium hirsutum]|uniref:Uncharacterized protein isoform X1 n=1 Tax=Gossypium hirsutum TaxID=3635 RepID=A0ABM3BHL6_GOSHI|nr:uncharacterized protein LOC107939599 isoform X1 [Gossypium hirsutum]XP_040966517.1 uncharacterized protein LOC107939599 isoform X1 [Gossypium hirsutum]XP_040966518.1 uncharacterized protein LOC107939599 isoform X1 [Gossypium hirsutum]XP_040966519.1 uncharacterized protein LOC107939599 isoform X1 [Gossypium hirsutum]XP_040966520.1 uncharacterized protein LOC107939599 isoform X1 [Gossypium hirsutum]XP_040966521.1 uncharacterized protein LOC107939599 isoform X1 [Gossypium hirsutum]